MEISINSKGPAIQASPKVIYVIYWLDIPKREGEFYIDKNRKNNENNGNQ
jgi:hypothetical protein